MLIEFWVPGVPKPGGSKKGYPIRTGRYRLDKNGKPLEIIRVNIKDDSKNVMEWRSDVVNACLKVFNGPPLLGPLRRDITFFFLRPNNHFGTGKNDGVLRASAPLFPQGGEADVTKLLRSTEDALNGVLWKDDKQVVGGWVVRLYAERSGAKIKVEEL